MSISQLNEVKTDQVHEYMKSVYKKVEERNEGEYEFLQAVREIFDTIKPVLYEYPAYMKLNILERIVEPDRMISFKVSWVDDEGNVQVNRGFRVQFNNLLGPYKGGLRFHPTVNSSIVKFLGFEQIFKNALTGQSIGGGKGGADFDPKGKSDLEIMRFCRSFMTELSRHIGPDVDVPAGDVGVGEQEIGYLFGQYRKMRNSFEPGVLTGKPLAFGGSLGRKEATGYGTIYFVKEMLEDNDYSFEGAKVVVSGSGNVALYAMEKATELGATVVACSDSSGCIYDENGLDIEFLKQIKEDEKERVQHYTTVYSNAKYVEGCEHIWSFPCDIALPCATQNELDLNAAKALVKNNVKAVGEGANMPCTYDAVNYLLDKDVLMAPAKAANAGGVAVSALEMAQNNMRTHLTKEEVDARLQQIMKNIYAESIEAAKKYDDSENLVVGANIASFIKVANAIVAQGV